MWRFKILTWESIGKPLRVILKMSNHKAKQEKSLNVWVFSRIFCELLIVNNLETNKVIDIPQSLTMHGLCNLSRNYYKKKILELSFNLISGLV